VQKIVGTRRAFTTDWGTFDLAAVLKALRASDDEEVRAAADIIEIMMPDHMEAQEKRRRIAALKAEIDAITGEVLL
jgi:hypothetical protein